MGDNMSKDHEVNKSQRFLKKEKQRRHSDRQKELPKKSQGNMLSTWPLSSAAGWNVKAAAMLVDARAAAAAAGESAI